MGLFDLFSADQGTQNARRGYKEQEENIKKGIGALNKGQTSAIGALDTGAEKAVGAYQPMLDRGQRGIDASWELLQNPDSVFNSELYKSREAAGIEGINRGANARGMLASGNNTQDILDYMRRGGLDYFNTLQQGYQPFFGLGQNAAAGIAGTYNQQGANKSNVYTGTAQGIANQHNALGQAGYQQYADIQAAQSAANKAPWDVILGLGKAAATAYAGA